jgi:hypothetical protein
MQAPPSIQPLAPTPRPAQLNSGAAPAPNPRPTAPAPRTATTETPHPSASTKQVASTETRRPPTSAKLNKKKAPRNVDLNQIREKIRGKVHDWVMSTPRQSNHPESRNGRPPAKGDRLRAHS